MVHPVGTWDMSAVVPSLRMTGLSDRWAFISSTQYDGRGDSRIRPFTLRLSQAPVLIEAPQRTVLIALEMG